MADYQYDYDDQEEKPGWGFKWNSVGLGLILLLGGGLWIVGGLMFDRIFFVPMGLCLAGIYYLIDGLGGADGVW